MEAFDDRSVWMRGHRHGFRGGSEVYLASRSPGNPETASSLSGASVACRLHSPRPTCGCGAIGDTGKERDVRTRPESTLLAVIDLQERLVPVIPGGEEIVARTVRLAQAAELLGVRQSLTEQYPKGLGSSLPVIAACLPAAEEKTAFSAAGCGCLAVEPGSGIESVVLAGIETHVCILQTALDLVAKGVTVFVAVDAVGSRFAIDHEVGLRRMEQAGVVLTTSESLLFEWCQGAEHARFREVRSLITGK